MPVAADEVCRVAELCLQPGRFSTARPGLLSFSHSPAEEIPWEIFQGRLLDPAYTRHRQTFQSWNVHLAGGDPAVPLLSIQFSAEGRVHVVRAVEVYAQEGYDAGGNVYQTRERRKWTRELIASFALADLADAEELRQELLAALERAVTGVRVPLTPTEAPLPAFSFGELFYRGTKEDARLHAPESSRQIEAWLRFTPRRELPVAATELVARWTAAGGTAEGLLATFRRMFNEVSLSPWTDFADKFLLLLTELEQIGTLRFEPILDLEGYLLRQLGRHLAGYDLVSFHHRGANYPDALLLDLLLTDFLARLEQRPEAFTSESGRLRRRALRQAWVTRRRYEGWPVPDAPTSPGENARVSPESHPRVREEQIVQPAARRRRLFADAPLTARLTSVVREALAQSLTDLVQEEERQELGAAVFFDRPFGGAKTPVEPDATLLLASLAYSRSLAANRLSVLASDLRMRAEVDLELPGLPTSAITPPRRPGALSLTDAGRSAADFVFRYTLPGSVQALRELLALTACEEPDPSLLRGQVLLAPTAAALVVYDETLRPRLHLLPRLEQGYASRRGVEYPRGGFVVRQVG